MYPNSELARIDHKAPTISVKVSDYHGNSTHFLGLNELDSITAILEFILNRKAFLEEIK